MRLAYKEELLIRPIVRELQNLGWQLYESDSPASLLLEGKVDVVIGPAIDYARSLGVVEYALFPEFGVIGMAMSGLMRIAFRSGQENLASIATNAADSPAAIVAGMLLIEKHDIEPNFVEVPTGSDLALMLDAADGALLSGDESFASLSSHKQALDLADEWEDLAEAPLPYLLAWGNSETIEQPAIDQLVEARDRGVLTFPDLAAADADPARIEALYERYLSGAISFSLPKDLAADVLEPYFRLAFYHGVIADIPSIKFLPRPEEERAE